MSPAYDFFDHDADIGIVGRGTTLEAAFEAAAQAMFSIMIDPGKLGRSSHLAFEFGENDVELALVTWLNRLLAEARSHSLMLGAFKLVRSGDLWHGEAWGSPWSKGAEGGVEVKGATLTMLSVRECDGAWEARCVVDV
ncbi:MAG: archease [Sulfuricellaceae bacterium]|jgi:SHS2 domain-containing protein